jgi:hypothetical protein
VGVTDARIVRHPADMAQAAAATASTSFTEERLGDRFVAYPSEFTGTGPSTPTPPEG